MAGLALLLALGLALAVVLGAWTIARRLRNPPRRTYAWAVARAMPGDPGELARPRAWRAWELEWDGARCPVWDIAGDEPEGCVLVLTPGWGDSRLGALVRLEALGWRCARAIAWDPPGLGECAGRWPMGTREHHALARLVRDLRESGERRPIALMGWSAGAGTSIAAQALLEERGEGCACVIAEAPYRLAWTPAQRVLRGAGYPWAVIGPLAFACLGVRLGVGARWRGFDRAQIAAGVEAPLLTLHGDADRVCPIEDGEAIAERAVAGELAAIEGGGHNDLWTDERHRARCVEAVGGFLAGLRAVAAE